MFDVSIIDATGKRLGYVRVHERTRAAALAAVQRNGFSGKPLPAGCVLRARECNCPRWPSREAQSAASGRLRRGLERYLDGHC